MTEQQQAAMRQALEALEKDVRFYRTEKLAAITALRRALEQQPAPDLSHLKPHTQEAIKGWLADGTFVDRAIGVMHDQEREIMRLKQQPADKRHVAYVCPQCMWTLEQQPADEPVATLWQHGETGRTRVTMPGDITDCDASWFKAADLYTRPQPAAPAMFGGGLVAIKTLLSRDPCAHAKVAIEMIDAMLAAAPEQKGN